MNLNRNFNVHVARAMHSMDRNPHRCKIVPLHQDKFRSPALPQKPIKLFITAGDSKILIAPEEIIYAQAHGNYCKIFLENGSAHLLSKTLKKLLLYLPTDLFLRSHQSFIVNYSFIKTLNANDQIVVQVDNKIHRIPISRRRKVDCINKIQAFN